MTNDLDKRNEELDEKMSQTSIEESIASIVRDAAKRKTQVAILAVLVAFSIMLGIFVGLLGLVTHRIAIQAESNKQAIIHNCETSNIARANNKQLWGYLLNIPPKSPLSADDQAQLDKFKGFVDTTFAPRDCSAEADNQ